MVSAPPHALPSTSVKQARPDFPSDVLPHLCHVTMPRVSLEVLVTFQSPQWGVNHETRGLQSLGCGLQLGNLSP